jgi:hypothetical protein
MCKTMDNKHKKNYFYAYLCGHTIVDVYENNTITTKTNQLVDNPLHTEAPIDQQEFKTH